MSCGPRRRAGDDDAGRRDSGSWARWCSGPCSRSASRSASRRWRPSGRRVRWTRRRGSPSTGPCSAPASRCSSSVSAAFDRRLAYRRATRRRPGAEPNRRRAARAWSNAAARTGLPAPAVAGLRFSLERGPGPHRGAGALGARRGRARGRVVVATITFGSGLDTLVSHPALYGWNWSYAIDSPAAATSRRKPSALLDHDPDVAAWTGYNFANVQIDGQTVPCLVGTSRTPPSARRSCRATASRQTNQIVLGAATLAELHKKVGDTVVAQLRDPAGRPGLRPADPPRDRGHRHDAGHRHAAARSTPRWGPGALISQRPSSRARFSGPSPARPQPERPGHRRRAAPQRRRRRPPAWPRCNGSPTPRPRSWPPIPTARATPTSCWACSGRPRS